MKKSVYPKKYFFSFALFSAGYKMDIVVDVISLKQEKMYKKSYLLKIPRISNKKRLQGQEKKYASPAVLKGFCESLCIHSV